MGTGRRPRGRPVGARRHRRAAGEGCAGSGTRAAHDAEHRQALRFFHPRPAPIHPAPIGECRAQGGQHAIPRLQACNVSRFDAVKSREWPPWSVRGPGTLRALRRGGEPVVVRTTDPHFGIGGSMRLMQVGAATHRPWWVVVTLGIAVTAPARSSERCITADAGGVAVFPPTASARGFESVPGTMLINAGGNNVVVGEQRLRNLVVTGITPAPGGLHYDFTATMDLAMQGNG